MVSSVLEDNGGRSLGQLDYVDTQKPFYECVTPAMFVCFDLNRIRPNLRTRSIGDFGE